MFTDEKMEKVFAEKGIDGIRDVMQVLLDTLGNKTVSAIDIRRANNTWLLFCSRHKELQTPDANYMFVKVLSLLNPQYAENIHAICNWGGVLYSHAVNSKQKISYPEFVRPDEIKKKP